MLRIKHLTSLVAAASLLAACGLFGPSYTKPDTANPAKFVSQDVLSVTESANLPMQAWWKKFNDQALNSLIESALRNNNNIQVAIGNIEAAHGYLRQIQFAWIPTASAQAGYSSQLTQTAGEGYNFTGLPSYSLNIFQQIRAQQAAKANYQASIAAKDAVRISVISSTVTGYFTLLGQDYQLQLQQQLVKDLKDLLALAKIEYQAGLISLYQLQNYQQQYETAQAQVPIISANIVASRNALRVLLNENPGDIKRGLAFMQLKGDGIVSANLPSQVLRNRPDVRQAEQQLIAANANIGVATSMFFPSISLTGSGGTAAQSLSGLFGANTDFWMDTAAISMPILNFGIYGQIEQAKGKYYAAYYNYLQVVRTAFASVDNDLAAHQQVSISLNNQVQAYNSTFVAYNLAESSYQQGLYSKPQLLQNAVTMDNSALVVQQSKLQQLGTIVQLYQDLGGGYAYQNFESTTKFGDAHDWD